MKFKKKKSNVPIHLFCQIFQCRDNEGKDIEILDSWTGLITQMNCTGRSEQALPAEETVVFRVKGALSMASYDSMVTSAIFSMWFAGAVASQRIEEEAG